MSMKKQQNGSYVWISSIDPEYHRNSIRPGIYICIGIAAFLLLFGGVLSWQYKDLKSFLIVAACTGVFILIFMLAFGLAFSAKDPQERYELTEVYVKIGSGKYSVYYDFEKLRQVTFHRNYIELRGRIRRARVYTSTEEDMDVVKRYIMNRLTGNTEIRYLESG